MQADFISIYSDNELVVATACSAADVSLSALQGGCTLMLCEQGRAVVEVKDERISVREEQLLLLPSGCKATSCTLTDDARVIIVCLSNALLRAFVGQHLRTWNHAVFVRRQRVWAMTPTTMKAAAHSIEALRLMHDDIMDDDYDRSMAQAYARMMVLAACSIFGRTMGEGDVNRRTQTGGIFQRFLDLLDRDGAARHSVGYYANLLCITPKYLSIVCVKHTQRTAKDWIDDYMKEAARRYLTASDKSMKEISDVLGFPNASYFGRFVKEHLGTSPLSYRVGTASNRQTTPSSVEEEAEDSVDAAATGRR